MKMSVEHRKSKFKVNREKPSEISHTAVLF